MSLDPHELSLARGYNAEYAATSLSPWYTEIETAFRQSFNDHLAALDKVGAAYDFTGFVFPEMQIPGPFAGPADFRGSIFRRRAVFHNTEFQRGAKFDDCKFRSSAVFIGSTLRDHASFLRAEFEGPANFSQATFVGPAIFNHATFTIEATFFGTIFERHADLSSRFKGGASFRRAEFRDRVYFSGSTFADKVRFLDTQLNECEFENLDPESAAQLVFDNVDLSRAAFRNSNIEGAVFRHVIWRHAFNRNILWEELRPLTGDQTREYGRIAENYRQLVINYERKRDFDSAENFHIGEMEMRRMMLAPAGAPQLLKIIHTWFNGYALYSFLSRYGTSYTRAFLILIAMVVVFAFGFMLSGLRVITDGYAIGEHVIRYRLCLSPQDTCVSARELFSDTGDAILYTLAIATFQRERPYAPDGMYSKFWMVFATVSLAGQAALLLLAIRRRFKR